MTPTFLVAIDTGSDTDLLAIADDIKEALISDGFEVQTVHPWQQQAAAPLLPTLSPEQNKQQTT